MLSAVVAGLTGVRMVKDTDDRYFQGSLFANVILDKIHHYDDDTNGGKRQKHFFR